MKGELQAEGDECFTGKVCLFLLGENNSKQGIIGKCYTFMVENILIIKKHFLIYLGRNSHLCFKLTGSL